MVGEGWDYEPDLDGYEPDPEWLEAGLAAWRFSELFPKDERHFDQARDRYTDPEMDLAARFDDLADPLAEMFRAALFLLGWRLGKRIAWPLEAIDPVRVQLMILAAARCGTGPHLAPDGADLTGIESAPLTHARATLTAAPPARVCQAGTAG
jgi:hypothetical protein